MRRGSRAATGLGKAAGAALAVSLLAAACSGSSGGSGGKITLSVSTFSTFGYENLYKQYEKTHPNIKIVQHIQSYPDHHQNLATHLATGAGAADIEAIDEGYIAQFKAEPSKFVNLLDLGAGAIKDRWVPWKWDESLSADGKSQIGLGTDVGGLAICYRSDLFAQAGLPSDRDAVSKLWADGWDSFFAAGRKFAAAKIPGVHFYDSSGYIFNGIMGQSHLAYYDEQGNLIVNSNPAVKQAWDQVVGAIHDGLSAKLNGSSPQWNAAFQKGSFAVVTCPGWMMANIKQQAAKFSGKWDVAAIPGGAGGNWGGSFLSIPKQSKHPKQAYDLAKFLTSPQSETAVFKKLGNLPSEPQLYTDPQVAGFTDPFFRNAPTGKIFTTAAEQLKPQVLGPKSGPIKDAFGQALLQVEAGKSADSAWNQLMKTIKQITAS
ncbi:MAG TPA: extracellular solute-binding protein [Mycobacteriales bacterium]|nr:extracellular solute-binding protein [Mycobacteriales bacterium]